MDERYTEYFAARLAGLPLPPAFTDLQDLRELDFRTFEIVQQGLAQAHAAARERGVALRGDAEMLLRLTFVEVVTRPILAVRPDATDDLLGDVAADMRLITARSSEISGEPFISAHSVVNAVSGLWPELATARWELWD